MNKKEWENLKKRLRFEFFHCTGMIEFLSYQHRQTIRVGYPDCIAAYDFPRKEDPFTLVLWERENQK